MAHDAERLLLLLLLLLLLQKYHPRARTVSSAHPHKKYSDAERAARRVLQRHPAEVERILSALVSCIDRLKGMDCEGWRKEGSDLVDWMQGEADDMANAERDVAITKTSGGSACILGGVMTGVGIVGSFFTFGLAAPLAVSGLTVIGAGAATSAGGHIARLSIVHMKTCEIKKRCEGFEQRSKDIVAALLELRAELTKLSELCKAEKALVDGRAGGIEVIDIVLKSGRTARTNLVRNGVNTRKVSAIVDDIAERLRRGLIFGADFVEAVAGIISGSSLSNAEVLFGGAGAIAGIGFGIWEGVEASGTLRNGGSHSKLIRDNASGLKNVIAEIDTALRQLDL